MFNDAFQKYLQLRKPSITILKNRFFALAGKAARKFAGGRRNRCSVLQENLLSLPKNVFRSNVKHVLPFALMDGSFFCKTRPTLYANYTAQKLSLAAAGRTRRQ